MTRWEYASIGWLYSTDQDEGKKSTWKQVYTIYWPDGTTEDRLGWNSERTDAESATLAELENELGAEGWEMVATSVLDSVVMTKLYGWPNVGTPVRRSWVFKRPLAE